MKQIITHDGLYHADELFTIALLFRVYGVVPIKRTRKVTEAELEDPETWVLDQYNKYEPSKHNFDHHQDSALSATNVLVLDYLKDQGLVSEDMHLLFRRPFAGISDYDVKGPLPFNGFQVNEFFKAFNNLPNGFDIALAIARTWIDATYSLQLKKEEALRIFKNGRSIEGVIKVCSDYPVFWQGMGTEKLLVAPEKGHWRLHSADTEQYPIVSTGTEIFLHANRFIATYRNKQDAVEAAKLTARLISLTPIL